MGMTFGSIYNDRLIDAKKLIVKTMPELKNNSYNIRWYKFENTTDFSNDDTIVCACTAIDEYGDKCIIVNNDYEKEDLRALACLLAHELTHVLKTPTLEEEIQAYKNEAKAWDKLKSDNVKPSELTKLLDFISLIHKQGEIEQYITNSDFYINKLNLS